MNHARPKRNFFFQGFYSSSFYDFLLGLKWVTPTEVRIRMILGFFHQQIDLFEHFLDIIFKEKDI